MKMTCEGCAYLQDCDGWWACGFEPGALKMLCAASYKRVRCRSWHRPVDRKEPPTGDVVVTEHLPEGVVALLAPKRPRKVEEMVALVEDAPPPEKPPTAEEFFDALRDAAEEVVEEAVDGIAVSESPSVEDVIQQLEEASSPAFDPEAAPLEVSEGFSSPPTLVHVDQEPICSAPSPRPNTTGGRDCEKADGHEGPHAGGGYNWSPDEKPDAPVEVPPSFAEEITGPKLENVCGTMCWTCAVCGSIHPAADEGIHDTHGRSACCSCELPFSKLLPPAGDDSKDPDWTDTPQPPLATAGFAAVHGEKKDDPPPLEEHWAKVVDACAQGLDNAEEIGRAVRRKPEKPPKEPVAKRKRGPRVPPGLKDAPGRSQFEEGFALHKAQGARWGLKDSAKVSRSAWHYWGKLAKATDWGPLEILGRWKEFMKLQSPQYWPEVRRLLDPDNGYLIEDKFEELRRQREHDGGQVLVDEVPQPSADQLEARERSRRAREG